MDGPSQTVLNSTIGCTLIGLLFAVMFYGFSLAQTTYYYLRYPEDPTMLKAFVAFLWVLDTARTSLDLQYLWYYVVDNHANPDGLLDFPISWVIEFFLATITVLAVQLYYANTVWKFLSQWTYRIPIVGSLILFCLASCAGGIATVWEFNRNSSVKIALENATYTGCIQTISATVADIYIAIALSFILHGKRTGFAWTDSLLTKLVIFAIHRGILSAIMQLGHFISFITTLQDLPNKLYWALFHFPGSKIYVNSLLAVLNLRSHLRQTLESGERDETSVSLPLEGFVKQRRFRKRPSNSFLTTALSVPALDEITVTTESIVAAR